MNGLVNRSLQLFVEQTFGKVVWHEVTRQAGIGFSDFEGMMRYEDTFMLRLLDAMELVLDRRRAELMEDLGTFIVSHHSFERVRRLLRFGGVDFVDFLHSLDDLDERVRLAVPHLDLPKIELHATGDGQFMLHCDARVPGYGHLMIGVLRAMADDYGALVMLEQVSQTAKVEIISVRLVEQEFAVGRNFELGACP